MMTSHDWICAILLSIPILTGFYVFFLLLTNLYTAPWWTPLVQLILTRLDSSVLACMKPKLALAGEFDKIRCLFFPRKDGKSAFPNSLYQSCKRTNNSSNQYKGSQPRYEKLSGNEWRVEPRRSLEG
ncbi:hypothetical protein SLE2022_082640 [Rubroshorea leprosula]